MKKIIVIVICLFVIKTNQSKAQVADTSAYLQEILTNKNTYIGKPFSTLEKDLQIKIKYFCPLADIARDISKETSTLFQFIKPVTDKDFSEPILEILWTPYLDKATSESLWNQNDKGGCVGFPFLVRVKSRLIST